MRRILAALLTVCLWCALSGCDLWMDGNYFSVKPHLEENDGSRQESMEVTSFEQLQTALIELVEDGGQSSVIYMPGFQPGQLTGYMDRAIRYLTQNHAISAYAVDEIVYEIGTNTGRTAIAVDITYIHNRSEILRIRKTQSMADALEVIHGALEGCEAGIVVQIAAYEDVDFTQTVQDYVADHPDTCMEMPQVAAAVYPESGEERVVELTFTYQTSRDALRDMQAYVEPVFEAADLNVSGEETESAKFALMYAFLMERSDYQVETSITPAYSLLRHGVGDSKAFATVYAAMCRRAELDCQVVTGTRGGEPWVWNIICEDGIYYHVDLLSSVKTGRLHKLHEADMQGYVWDYSAYPATGTKVPDVPETQPDMNDG